ncbi:MAG: hypothetical protein AB1Z98_36770 [Nannocystaceae bacterium]
MRRIRLASCLLLVPVLGCPDDGAGDDLPPGAFTSGPDDDGTVFDSSTTQDSGATGPSTESGSTGPDDESSSGPPPVLFHDQDILPIWMASCIDAACHDAEEPQAALDLASEGVYDRLCSSFHGQSGMPYIDCVGLDPQNSYVFRKIENTHLMGISGALGGPMPPGESLSDQQINTIAAWISGGAMP